MRTRAIASGIVATLLVGGTACDREPALQRLSEARRLTAELLAQFTQATDAANRAVMANTDEASMAFAREAGEATEAVQRDTEALKPLLLSLSYSDEVRWLEEFDGRFAEYRVLDRRILELAVENTNVKAQRLSFGPAQVSADAFRDAVESAAHSASAQDLWRARALAATAISAVREIQVLQAPHIADADDEAMARMEKQMATEEATARSALEALTHVVQPSSKPRLAEATGALDKFMDLNMQLVALSRRNTNVRSLAMSLGEKGMLTARCEESLRALQDALAKRGFTGTR